MKFPSRWEQPGDAHAVPHRRHRRAPSSPLSLTSCTYHLGRDTTTPSLPATPSVAYFLGTTARFGPFFGALPRVDTAGTHWQQPAFSRSSFALGLQPRRCRQSGRRLHRATPQPRREASQQGAPHRANFRRPNLIANVTSW